MWTEVYVSQKSEKVDKIVERLNAANIISRVRRINGAKGTSSECFSLLVPGTELEEAQSIVVDGDLL